VNLSLCTATRTHNGIDTILTARSSGDTNDSARPILTPCQHRQGVFHALMHMISQLVQSFEDKLLEGFSDTTSLYVDRS
jgi:hypothetical protein